MTHSLLLKCTTTCICIRREKLKKFLVRLEVDSSIYVQYSISDEYLILKNKLKRSEIKVYTFYLNYYGLNVLLTLQPSINIFHHVIDQVSIVRTSKENDNIIIVTQVENREGLKTSKIMIV